MNYEDLICNADTNKLDIIEIPFKGQAKGYYSNGVIALNNKIETITEKKCILAEEIGHHFTTDGYILDKSIISIKKEHIARRWASENLIRILDLIDAFNNGITGKSELAEYLDVTEEFLESTITYYKQKYGTHFQIDNYLIFFEPSFGIMKLL